MRRATRASALLFIVPLAACSAPDFSAPVLAFDQAVGEGRRLVEAYGQARAEANFALRRAAIAQRADQVVVRGADCRPGAPAAECVVRIGPGRTPVGQAVPAARPAGLAGALDRYADGLVAVASAMTEAELETATGRLAASVAGLERAGARMQGAPARADPAAGVIGAVGGLGLQQRRFAALASAINAADPAVRQAAGELAALVAGQREAVADDRAALIARLAALYNAMEPRGGIEGAAVAATRDALLARIADLAAAQRRLLADDPTPDLRGLGEAHAALRRAVNDPAPPHAQLTADLNRLSDQLRRAADAAMRLPSG
jgi:hypothetical protein